MTRPPLGVWGTEEYEEHYRAKLERRDQERVDYFVTNYRALLAEQVDAGAEPSNSPQHVVEAR